MKKLTETQVFLEIIRSPIYSKRQKRTANLKWRLNQMPSWYRENNMYKYLDDIKMLENEPDNIIT